MESNKIEVLGSPFRVQGFQNSKPQNVEVINDRLFNIDRTESVMNIRTPKLYIWMAFRSQSFDIPIK